jgi:hypothetical protein
MEIWNSFCTPPPHVLKEITGGRLAGKTDINPQWRIRAMTETFGVCGIGWKWEIKRLWAETAPEGQMFAFAYIVVHIRDTSNLAEQKWSAPIEGVGGSMLVEKETKGLHANDEAFKMAITDALSYALKQLGVGADVYEGKMEGSKYQHAKTTSPEPYPPSPSTHPNLTEAQDKLFQALKSHCQSDKNEMASLLYDLTTFTGKDGKEVQGKMSFKDLSDSQARVAYGKFKNMPTEVPQEAPQEAPQEITEEEPF